ASTLSPSSVLSWDACTHRPNAREGGDGVDFVAIVDQAIALLRQRGRLTYRTLQLQFQLDDAHLAALKDELIEGQRLAVDEAGRVLIWTGDPAAPEPDAPRGAEVESRFHALLPEVRTLLQRDRRVTYRRLTAIFSLDQRLLEDVRRELLFQQVARDEQGEGLVWTGEARPLPSTTVDTWANGPIAAPAVIDSDVSHDASVGPSEPIR